MLGTLWEKEDPDKAVEYCQLTRDFAKRGLADSIGLAAAALGLEARVELRRGHFKRALELYLEQYADGRRLGGRFAALGGQAGGDDGRR